MYLERWGIKKKERRKEEDKMARASPGAVLLVWSQKHKEQTLPYLASRCRNEYARWYLRRLQRYQVYYDSLPALLFLPIKRRIPKTIKRWTPREVKTKKNRCTPCSVTVASTRELFLTTPNKPMKLPFVRIMVFFISLYILLSCYSFSVCTYLYLQVDSRIWFFSSSSQFNFFFLFSPELT